MSHTSPDYLALTWRGGKLFALKSQPPKNQPFLVMMESADKPDSAQVVVDPNRLNPKGTTAIDFFVPSRDGRLVAVSLSEGGSEQGTVHVYETANGKELADVIPRVNGATAGGSLRLEWRTAPASTTPAILAATSVPRKTWTSINRFISTSSVRRPSDDVYVIGKEFPRDRRDLAGKLSRRPLPAGDRRQWRWRRFRSLSHGPVRALDAAHAVQRSGKGHDVRCR